MRDAFAKDSRIHRDLSVRNIILVQVGDSSARRGYLIDWESSCKVDDSGDAVETGRAVSVYRHRGKLSKPKHLTSFAGHLAIHLCEYP